MKYNPNRYNLKKLLKEKEFIENSSSYYEGWGGHSVSFANESQVYNPSRNVYNQPYLNLLDKVGYFKEIYDSFETKVAGLRLVRREAGTIYKIHNDLPCLRDKYIRFQIPIVSENSCLYIMENENSVVGYNLLPGYLYSFDATINHTLINRSRVHRITLIMDLTINEWLIDYVKSLEVFGSSFRTLPRACL